MKISRSIFCSRWMLYQMNTCWNQILWTMKVKKLCHISCWIAELWRFYSDDDSMYKSWIEMYDEDIKMKLLHWLTLNRRKKELKISFKTLKIYRVHVKENVFFDHIELTLKLKWKSKFSSHDSRQMKNNKKKFQTKMTIEKLYSLLLTTLNSQITHDEMDADLPYQSLQNVT